MLFGSAIQWLYKFPRMEIFVEGRVMLPAVVITVADVRVDREKVAWRLANFILDMPKSNLKDICLTARVGYCKESKWARSSIYIDDAHI